MSLNTRAEQQAFLASFPNLYDEAGVAELVNAVYNCKALMIGSNVVDVYVPHETILSVAEGAERRHIVGSLITGQNAVVEYGALLQGTWVNDEYIDSSSTDIPPASGKSRVLRSSEVKDLDDNQRNSSAAVYLDGMLSIDRSQRKVLIGENQAKLSPLQLKIFELLLLNSPNILPKLVIAQEVWGSTDVDGHVVDVHIGQVRKRLGQISSYSFITNVSGLGYMSNPQLHTSK